MSEAVQERPRQVADPLNIYVKVDHMENLSLHYGASRSETPPDPHTCPGLGQSGCMLRCFPAKVTKNGVGEPA